MAAPDDRIPSDREAPMLQSQGPADDFDSRSDDTGVSLPAPTVPILPPDRIAPY